jgi:hypothetical protein
VLHPKFVSRGDGSEHNYMRSLRSSRDVCYCGLQVKIRRDDGNNYPRNQQHSDKFEPAIHGKANSFNYSPKLSLDCQIRGTGSRGACFALERTSYPQPDPETPISNQELRK